MSAPWISISIWFQIGVLLPTYCGKVFMHVSIYNFLFLFANLIFDNCRVEVGGLKVKPQKQQEFFYHEIFLFCLKNFILRGICSRQWKGKALPCVRVATVIDTNDLRKENPWQKMGMMWGKSWRFIYPVYRFFLLSF